MTVTFLKKPQAAASQEPVSKEFETETCGRCGGSGKYSFNQIDGDRCYGCGGAGKKLTKRGRIAHDWFESQLKVRADSLIVGDHVQDFVGMSGAKGFFLIKEIAIGLAKDQGCYRQPGDYQQVRLLLERKGHNAVSYIDADTLVRRGFSKAQKAPVFEQAMLLQDSLGKNGKPLKKVKQ